LVNLNKSEKELINYFKGYSSLGDDHFFYVTLYKNNKCLMWQI